MKIYTKIFILLTVMLLGACRGEDPIIPSTQTAIDTPYSGSITGLYLLNEGNMGNNKCTLDYMDIAAGTFHKNIYGERNPLVARELGDVGNDLQIYRDRLYAVVNCSNLVEVMSAGDASHIASVSIPNPRYIAFDGDFAYVSSYAGEVSLDNTKKRLGYIAKIDISTLKVVATCQVGYQPEQMAICAGKLYVANSGGYQAPDYDNRVMVVNLESFEVEKEIEVADNLHGVALDSEGKLWVSSRGDYYNAASRTYVIDTNNDTVVKEFDFANSKMVVVGDELYVISSSHSSVEAPIAPKYLIINTKSYELTTQNFITDGSQSDIVRPYGLAVNSETGFIYITDAKDYITPGTLHCYNSDGTLRWSVVTGDIPAHIAFTTKR